MWSYMSLSFLLVEKESVSRIVNASFLFLKYRDVTLTDEAFQKWKIPIQSDEVHIARTKGSAGHKE